MGSATEGWMPGSCSGLTLLWEIPDLGSSKNWDLEKQEESRAVIRPTHPFRKDLAEAPCDPATPQCHHAPPQSRHTTIPSSGTAHVPKCWSPHPPGAWLEGDTKQLVCVNPQKTSRAPTQQMLRGEPGTKSHSLPSQMHFSFTNNTH